ncbi:hypothetical protein ACFY3U_23930 [Micromonospora sp. NPDC000089]|uniref:hypothetical protein n=1 Tax=unclassified Micromonospora TaxID=2617518 RepID=UPI0036962D28
MAAAAGQVCRVPTAAAVAARRRLAETGTGFQPGNRVAWAADLSPLAAVGVVDSNAFLDGAADILAMLGGPEHRRGGLLGQSAVVIVADAITGAGGRYLLPPVQVDNLERVVRSESRLPDAVADGDPLDTALAVDLLRRLGRSAPGPVSWDAPLDLGTRAVLALALDHRQLPTAEAVARALVEQPADAIPVGYLTAAHPGLCLPRVSDLRADYATTPDLRTWTSDRLFEAAILVSTTAGCGGADQQALTGTLTGALDRLQQAPMTGPTSAASPAPVPLVENWYLAEAGCLLGQPTRYLLKVADLRRSVQREVGSERIRSEVTVRQLYAAVRLAELRADPGSCANTWWAAGLRR